MQIARLWIAPLLVATTFASIVSAQEWTRFRGPNGTGESEAAIPAQWGDKNMQWRVDLPGFGHGSPVLWKDRIYLLTAAKYDDKAWGANVPRSILCLDAKNGNPIWGRDYPSKGHQLHKAFSSYASCTPAVDAQGVYVAWSDWDHMTVAALDHEGKDLWHTDLGTFINQHGFGSSPVVYDDLVIVNCSQEDPKNANAPEPKGSFIVALDKATGKQRWLLPRKTDTASYSVPCIRKTSTGEELICCSTMEGIFAFDPKTGKENWSLADAFDKRTVSSPVLAGGLVFGTTGSGGGGNYVVACRPGSQPEVAYEIKTEAPYVPTPVAKGDLIFLWSDAGVARCLDAASGKELWKHRVSGRAFFGSPVRAGDKIFCIDDSGLAVCIAADRTFKELGKTDLKEECRSTPAIAGGKMYVRTVSHLYCIRGEK